MVQWKWLRKLHLLQITLDFPLLHIGVEIIDACNFFSWPEEPERKGWT